MQRIIIILSMLAIFSANIKASSKYEIRAAWITTIGGLDWPTVKATSAYGIKRQKEELCKQLDMLKEANFNTVLFQTRLRGDVIYPSIYETFAESLAGKTGRNPGYDPLKFAIEECHKRGMEIHAWMVCIPAGNDRQVKLLGKQSVVKKKPTMCIHFKRAWYLDPGNPETAKYLAAIAKEISMNYDIDGIHLDYIRYPENAENFPDGKTFRKYGKGKTISQWRRDNITSIVREIYNDVKLIKPWVKVSSSPVGKYDDTRRYSSKGWNAYNAVYQDAKLWLKTGIHDAIFPMMYFRDNHFYPFALDWEENKHGRFVVPGLGIYFLKQKAHEWDINEIMRQIYFTRRNGLDGQAFFRNEFLMKNTCGLTDSLKCQFYTYPAAVPPMVWQDSIAPAQPVNGVISFRNDSVMINWDKADSSKTEEASYHIYASDFYPVDINDGKNIICLKHGSNSFCYSLKAGKIKRFWAITATDRYGNESSPLEINRPADDERIISVNKLPEAPEGCIIVVNDITGMELFRTKSASDELIKKLQKGVYSIQYLLPDGKQENITLIMSERDQ
ncbi:glycoside hydrolase family 10 protein [Bacteroides sp. ET336]|uniref:glycoside hydrolase family 10 protein n=1 Tax=Bacteroides sp. ET336 TaxID=2972459 RepID=UPI0021ABA316|nr:family 10 glycosylhydrolase [Bacteroides sp. ET336]MCR8894426.1 family 10 glycosylhydrolase [Bacteroides sp. ET336]MDN0058922.1 family 10 glycosylhydrolase [Bacteroides caecigallinarum]